MSEYRPDFKLTDLFLECQCDRNEGCTRNLLLRGNELIKRIGRRLHDPDMVTLVIWLKKNPQVTSLEMPYNRIGCCGVYTLMEHIATEPYIKHLNLVGNDVGVDGVSKIVDLGEKLPFYTLRLAGNKIGKEGGILLSKLLYLDIPLKYLDVSDTHQTMSSLAYLMTGLMWNRGGSDKLAVVNLGRPLGQYYHTMCDMHAAELIAQVLQYNKGLKELHLQQYRFDCHDIETMVDGLLVNHTLTCLDLNNNNIGDDGVTYLCKYLVTRPTLRCLMIGANNIKDLGARTLSFSMPYSRVRLLDITNNLLTDTGVLDLLNTIRKPEPMRAIYFWGNGFSNRTLLVLDRMLQAGTLHQDHVDVRTYQVDGELHAAWYPSANRYTHRYYCVKDYAHPPLRRIKKNPPRPASPPQINFLHHTSDAEIGMPLYESDPESDEELTLHGDKQEFLNSNVPASNICSCKCK